MAKWDRQVSCLHCQVTTHQSSTLQEDKIQKKGDELRKNEIVVQKDKIANQIRFGGLSKREKLVFCRGGLT
ncbi:NADPH-dependent FMN reductase [Corchorus olitorius]|uniref:NADPH-dependent FMN reductase n=1 Tax=Corchorus olitorius TaxID=93759 RepID=A0A1R3J338_9ROSI|nr:NADPH-dependent FMN reductase [Corchorus olitorius]